MKKTIFVMVVFIHIFILFLAASYRKNASIDTSKPLVVKTISLKNREHLSTQKNMENKSEMRSRTVTKSQNTQSKKIAVSSHSQNQAIPSSKSRDIKKPSHPVSKKQSSSKAKIEDKKSSSLHSSVSPISIPSHLLDQLEEGIAKIDKEIPYVDEKKFRFPSAHVPTFSPQVILESTSENNNINERDALVAFLQQMLHLPDYGEVTINLHLSHDGKVTKLSVLKAQNLRNRRYLEEKLPTLCFPCEASSEKGVRTWTLTFCNG